MPKLPVVSELFTYAPRCFYCGGVATAEHSLQEGFNAWLLTCNYFKRIHYTQESEPKEKVDQTLAVVLKDWVGSLQQAGLIGSDGYSATALKFNPNDGPFYCDAHRLPMITRDVPFADVVRKALSEHPSFWAERLTEVEAFVAKATPLKDMTVNAYGQLLMTMGKEAIHLGIKNANAP